MCEIQAHVIECGKSEKSRFESVRVEKVRKSVGIPSILRNLCWKCKKSELKSGKSVLKMWEIRIENVGNLSWKWEKSELKMWEIQCLQSSLAQDGGGNHRQHCITDVQKALKTLIKSSQELPEIFKIVLRPIWWAAGNKQPSPPIFLATAGTFLSMFWGLLEDLWCNVAGDLILRPGPD